MRKIKREIMRVRKGKSKGVRMEVKDGNKTT